MRRLLVLTTIVATACAPSAEAPELEASTEALTAEQADTLEPAICLPRARIDDRSLILSDRTALAARDIDLRRVLATLASQTPDPLDGADTLYADLAATMGHGFGPGVVLDDWYGVALVNRFDLADKEGTTCGEYRLVVARAQRIMEPSRFTLIFEASLPNPRPELGRTGCRPLQQVWAGLSQERDPVARAAVLEQMYFGGVARFPPIVSIDHYGASGLGQVRGNFFLNGDLGPWILDEFSYQYTVTEDANGRRRIWGTDLVARPVADTLGVDIFAAGPPANADIAELRADFLAQLGALTAQPFDIRFTVPEWARAAESRAVVNVLSEGYVDSFVAGGGDGSHFGQQIAATLAARGITGITPTQVVRRAFTQSCGGCHDDARAEIGGGMTWPRNPLDRVFIIDPSGGTSGPLVAFLPERRARLQRFLDCRQ